MTHAYLDRARAIQRFTRSTLGYLSTGSDSSGDALLSYRRSDAEPQWSDLWYVATQLGADAALLRADPGSGAEPLKATARFLERFEAPVGPLRLPRLRGPGPPRGFLARGHPDGSNFLPGDKYCDDQAHLGLMLLDAFEATGDADYLLLARRAADWLVRANVWDDQFGGGFWWNSRRGDSPEGKPAQANGLAADLFAQLYGITGQPEYRDWAVRTLDWLDATLWDPRAELYRWSVAFADPARRAGRLLSTRLFNYDQGIIIEARLARGRHVRHDPDDLPRARAIAARLEPTFWHRPAGGFNLESGVEQVYAIYSAWLTPSLLALYREDPDPRWLELARRNVDALLGYLGAPDGGVYCRAYLDGDRWMVDRTRDTAANAGLQRALAALSEFDDD